MKPSPEGVKSFSWLGECSCDVTFICARKSHDQPICNFTHYSGRTMERGRREEGIVRFSVSFKALESSVTSPSRCCC
jgi:hypothetical protein